MVTFWAIWKNGTFPLKAAVDYFWATILKNLLFLFATSGHTGSDDTTNKMNHLKAYTQRMRKQKQCCETFLEEILISPIIYKIVNTFALMHEPTHKCKAKVLVQLENGLIFLLL